MYSGRLFDNWGAKTEEAPLPLSLFLDLSIYGNSCCSKDQDDQEEQWEWWELREIQQDKVIQTLRRNNNNKLTVRYTGNNCSDTEQRRCALFLEYLLRDIQQHLDSSTDDEQKRIN